MAVKLFKGRDISRYRPFFRLAYRLILLHCGTFRATVVDEDNWLDLYRDGRRVLLCSWHQQFFSSLGYFNRYRFARPAIMISRSRDGDLVSQVAELAGWHPVRGSSSRGGFAALKEMIKHLRRHRLAGHILDGPQGPAGHIKPGIIMMALAAGAVIVPGYMEVDRCWQLHSWDRFVIPKPFARVRFVFCKPFYPDKKRDFEEQRRELETILRSRLIWPPGEALPF